MSREWEDGPLAHLTRLRIPERSAAHGFRFSAEGRLFGGLLLARVYCDALSGVSGNDTDQDPVVAHLVTSGRLVYARRGVSRTAGPGQILIRDARTSWDFTCAPATRALAVTIPRHAVLARTGLSRAIGEAYMADATTPEVRLLLNVLEAIERSGDLDRSVVAQEIAVDACAALFARLLSGRSAPEQENGARATVSAAKNVIEKNLGSQGLSPAVISRLVGVPLRTLHRSFAESNDTVMAFTRRRRLQRAHDELLRQGASGNVSEIAARWQFADASHFIRQFKTVYGTTPAAYVRGPAAGEDLREDAATGAAGPGSGPRPGPGAAGRGRSTPRRPDEGEDGALRIGHRGQPSAGGLAG
ncbi:helix-turn-helix domain-containing protein [Streptomyces sp. NPDC006296]|uniref:helix-turn-helix domain-containing protein n=1 Tax=Streptomyces sp. NPDC006296 TaxID=3156746 RepID=UPI0033AB9E4C